MNKTEKVSEEEKERRSAVKPGLPTWVVPLSGALLILLCGGGVFGFNYFRSQNEPATATMPAQAGVLAEVTAVVATRSADKAQTEEQAAQATSAAATVTAEAAKLAGDDEGDGLSNSNEATATDNDGLSDGEEANQHGADGDSMPDSVDDTPGEAPTAMPSATEVPTAALTNAPSTTPTDIPAAPSTDTPTPTSTNTPQDTPTNTPPPASTITPSFTPTVTPPTELWITFENYPDGTPIVSDLILNGDEFLGWGIRVAGAPESPYCADASKAAVRMAYGTSYNFLTTARPGDINACNVIPIEIIFVNPARQVTLTFAGATIPYTLKAYDIGGVLLGSVAVEPTHTSYSGHTFEITFNSGITNIHRITFGRQAALTIIKQIYYDW